MNNLRITVRFKGSCLNETATFAPRNVANLFIVYKLGTWSQHLNKDFTLKDSLFGAAKLIKSADPDKYSYLGYDIGFDSRSLFSFPNFDWGKNVIFGVGNSSSTHIDNKKKDILILGKGPTQGLDDTTIAAEAEYCIIFSRFV